jgi:hypothetical protein
MQSASGSYRNLQALAEGFGGDALTEGKTRIRPGVFCATS